MPSTNEKCHFFRLPLELRDEIYDIVAAEEARTALRISLATSQDPEPKVAAYSTAGFGQASSEVRREYAVAFGRRVKTILEHKPSSGDPARRIRQKIRPRRQTALAQPQRVSVPRSREIEGDFLVDPKEWRVLHEVELRPLCFPDLKERLHDPENARTCVPDSVPGRNDFSLLANLWGASLGQL